MAETLPVSTREGVASLEGSEAHRSIPSGPQAALQLPSSPGCPLTWPSSNPLWAPPTDSSARNPHRFPAVLCPALCDARPMGHTGPRVEPTLPPGEMPPLAPSSLLRCACSEGARDSRSQTRSRCCTAAHSAQISPFRNEGGFNSASE